MKQYQYTPLLHSEDVLLNIPYGATVIGVDLVEGAVDLTTFCHPKSAYYIFGAEDDTLGQRILSRCDYKIKIDTNRCLNLAMAVGTVLYDRMIKESKEKLVSSFFKGE